MTAPKPRVPAPANFLDAMISYLLLVARVLANYLDLPYRRRI